MLMVHIHMEQMAFIILSGYNLRIHCLKTYGIDQYLNKYCADRSIEMPLQNLQHLDINVNNVPYGFVKKDNT